MDDQTFPLPTRIRVGYRIYVVYPMSYADMERLERHGETNKRRAEIYVCNQDAPLVVLDTLLHEINHAIWNEYNLSESEDEEKAVHMLSSGMVQVLHDNPKLVKVCLKLLKEAANAVQSD
jgi:hypothetical protein